MVESGPTRPSGSSPQRLSYAFLALSHVVSESLGVHTRAIMSKRDQYLVYFLPRWNVETLKLYSLKHPVYSMQRNFVRNEQVKEPLSLSIPPVFSTKDNHQGQTEAAVVCMSLRDSSDPAITDIEMGAFVSTC